jgi:uncharacterized protein YqeY
MAGAMSLQERLMADLQTAMREGDATRREAIRMLRAAILNDEIDSGRRLNEDETLRVVERVVRRHHDSIEQFQKGGRADLVAHEQAQLAAIQIYLPQKMPREEIEVHVRAAINETGARGRGDTGKLMQRLAGELRGKADLKEVNRVVQELLGA